MRLAETPEEVTDWFLVPATTATGASGFATIRAHQAGEVQLRMAVYGPCYLADHWCLKGHVIYVISGTLAIEHEDGTPPLHLAAGVSWQAGDGVTPAHRVRTEQGTTVFVPD